MIIFKTIKCLQLTLLVFWNSSMGFAAPNLDVEIIKNKKSEELSMKSENAATYPVHPEPLIRKPGDLCLKKCTQYYPVPYLSMALTQGKPARVSEFPHMASIGYQNKNKIDWKCGGSLISKKYVLTAAHCLLSGKGPMKVRLGNLDLSNRMDDSCQEFTVVRSIPHPLYKTTSMNHDIALLELDREAKFTKFVSPACLNTEKDFDEPILTATGWGNTIYVGRKSKILLKIDMKYIPYSKCAEAHKKYSSDAVVDDFHVCAKGDMGKDTCPGDSGGPLQVRNQDCHHPKYQINVYNIVGVTAFGKPCGIYPGPSVYTKVSNYISWIEGIAWQNESEDPSPKFETNYL